MTKSGGNNRGIARKAIIAFAMVVTLAWVVALVVTLAPTLF
ncbi:MAG: hypothetical protein WAS73_12610 [Defluviicoccus sp.]